MIKGIKLGKRQEKTQKSLSGPEDCESKDSLCDLATPPPQKKRCGGRWEGTCQYAQLPELDTHGRRKEPTSISCPLNYTHIHKYVFVCFLKKNERKREGRGREGEGGKHK